MQAARHSSDQSSDQSSGKSSDQRQVRVIVVFNLRTKADLDVVKAKAEEGAL